MKSLIEAAIAILIVYLFFEYKNGNLSVTSNATNSQPIVAASPENFSSSGGYEPPPGTSASGSAIPPCSSCGGSSGVAPAPVGVLGLNNNVAFRAPATTINNQIEYIPGEGFVPLSATPGTAVTSYTNQLNSNSMFY